MTIPLIIESSLNGATSKAINPNVPYSDEEIVADALACMEAGAALIHNHTDESIFGGSGELDYERYARPWRLLLRERPDAILTPTMPVGQEGVTVETRYRHVERMAEEGLLAQGLCDPGTFNLSVLDEDGPVRAKRHAVSKRHARLSLLRGGLQATEYRAQYFDFRARVP